MQLRPFAVRTRCREVRHTALWLLLLLAFLAGCADEPRARSFMEFMEDSYAREGTLARCNRDREATAGDVECANARRAAQMIAAQADEARREQREAESEALLIAARERAAQEQLALEQAEAAARAEEEALYEAQWTGSTEVASSDALAPTVTEEATYDSLASTLGVVGPPRPLEPAPVAEPAPAVDVTAEIALLQAVPSLEPLQIPADAAPALPYVELPAPPPAAD
ncbi:MAG TPA: EexN family lipoprotein [Gammaproteobacteria bacterium]